MDDSYLLINSPTNYLSFGYANAFLVRQIAKLLEMHQEKPNMKNGKLVLSIDHNLIVLLLAGFPEVNTAHKHFEQLNLERRESVNDISLYYNMLVKSLRERIQSNSFLVLNFERLDSVVMAPLMSTDDTD